jgi:DNA replication licensing factor MCM3
LSIKFVKKYIQYSKNKPAPVLTKGAADHIVQVYANLRNEDMAANQKKVCLCSRYPSSTHCDPRLHH